jgi:hypothetical protein
VILTPAAERGTGMVKKAKELAEEHGWFLASQFDNEANPRYHAQVGVHLWRVTFVVHICLCLRLLSPDMCVPLVLSRRAIAPFCLLL